MKWDVKHDRAKKVLNHFLDNAGYWTETESLTEGLTEDEIQEVSTEVATMIQSITKRYKLDVVLPAEPVVKAVQDSIFTAFTDAGVNFKFLSDEKLGEIEKAIKKKESESWAAKRKKNR